MLKRTLVVAMLVALPMTAFAQSSSDVAYCKALSAKWCKYNKAASPACGTATAIAQCDKNPGASISTLEKSLNDNHIPLPARN